jgi:hypothetical protein
MSVASALRLFQLTPNPSSLELLYPASYRINFERFSLVCNQPLSAKSHYELITTNAIDYYGLYLF